MHEYCTFAHVLALVLHSHTVLRTVLHARLLLAFSLTSGDETTVLRRVRAGNRTLVRRPATAAAGQVQNHTIHDSAFRGFSSVHIHSRLTRCPEMPGNPAASRIVAAAAAVLVPCCSAFSSSDTLRMSGVAGGRAVKPAAASPDAPDAPDVPDAPGALTR